jgi:selenocysteine lyase/cysteine desulfurase
VNELGVDMLSFSAHKFYGLKELVCSMSVRGHGWPILFGGGQSRDVDRVKCPRCSRNRLAMQLPQRNHRGLVKREVADNSAS